MLKNIPINWVYATLDDLISIDGIFCDGDWIESKDQDKNGDVRLIQLADIGNGIFKNKSKRFLTYKKSVELGCTYLEKGDILIARLPDPLGRACIFPLINNNKYVTAVDVCVYRPNNDNVNGKYILFLLNSPQSRAEIDKYKSGSTRKRISRKNLSRIKFPIAPLPEQHRIVQKIEELFSDLDNGIENLKQAKEQLKVYRQSVLKWAFDGKLTEEWRKTHKPEPAKKLLEQIKQEREAQYQMQLDEWQEASEDAHNTGERKPIKPKKPMELPTLTEDEVSELQELPIGWKWTKLNHIADKITDGEHITPERTEAGFFLLSARNIQDGYLDLTTVDYIPENEYMRIIKRCNPEEGDILISCSGSVGRICRVPKNIKFTMVRSVALVKLQTQKGTSKYYEYLLQSPELQRQIDRGKKATAQANLFLGPINNLAVPLCSLEEQIQIVQEIEARLSVAEKMAQTIEESLQKAEALRQSIIKKAFEGRLVPQDPNDEPAKKLLEHIRAEREKKM
jgi:type I restriction enzyme S subunit